MNRRKKGGFAAGCCVALLLITLCAAAGGGVLWYVGRTMAQPGSASMQGASGAPGGGAEDGFGDVDTRHDRRFPGLDQSVEDAGGIVALAAARV